MHIPISRLKKPPFFYIFSRAFSGDLATSDSLIEKYQGRGLQKVDEEDDREVANLLVDQVPKVDLIVVHN